jgi:CDP-diacylglycerol--serine O-phosphatidyltransferase
VQHRKFPPRFVRERVEDLSLAKLVPSALTLLGLASGVTAIRLAMEHNWKAAVAFVIFAMVFDMLDGRAARQLGADTRFGAQLDSLADLVSFGVAPALIAYNWTLSRFGEVGWIAAVIFCVCCAIRLARFNIQALRDEGATEANPYFTGMPTPAGACLMLLPLLLSFQFKWTGFQLPLYSCAIALATSILMVSRLSTPSIKYIHIQRQHRIFVVLLGLCAMAALAVRPWATLTVGIALYVLSIPIAVLVPPRVHEEEDEEDLSIA